MRFIALLFLLCTTFFAVHAWGPIGHSIVARLAQSQLTETAPEWIRSLIPWHLEGNLSAMASWADNILYADTNPTGFGNWQWSRTLHFIDVPDWNCAYDSKRDCVDDRCVAGAIRNYTKRLGTVLDEIQQQEALYFLIHFVGDSHQPLHTGFTSDRGANSIRGHFMNHTSVTNLHSMWDSGLINVRLQRDFSSNANRYYEHIYQLMLNQTRDSQDDSIEQWVEENLNLVCNQIYFDEKNAIMNMSVSFTLGDIYYHKNIPIIEQRLAKGGRRLAFILNELAKNRSTSSTPPPSTSILTSTSTLAPSTPTSTLTPSTPPTRPKKPKEGLCSGTIALIAVVAFECVLAIIISIIIFYRRKKPSSPPPVLSFSSKMP